MKTTKTKESATRKKIDIWLNNLGWDTDEESPYCNVFTERLKTEEQQKKLEGKEPDYSLYESGTNEIIGIIEAKRKGKNLDETLKDAIKKYVKPLDVPIVFACDGTFIKSWHFKDKKELTIDGEPLKDLISEEKLIRFIKEGSDIEEVSPDVKYTREELIKIFKWANDLLRKEGLRNLDRFVEFANILFIKIISEIEEDREKRGLKRRLDKEWCWESFENEENPQKMLNYINNTVLKEGLAKEYNHADDIFQEKLKIKNPDTVKTIVDKLSPLTLINTESEIKGDAFEYFLKSLVMGNDLGEYFTPRHIERTMIRLIDPKIGDTVFDPFCGTGGFLIEAFRHIKKRINEKDEKLMRLIREYSIFGIELTDTYKIAKMNMIITGDGHNNIIQDDTAKIEYWNKFIKNEKDKEKVEFYKQLKNEGFSVIFSNIPYGQQTDYAHLYPVQSNHGDSIFVQHIIKALKVDGGKCAVIVPEGLLFKEFHSKFREYLLDNCKLEAIISLPKGVFLPYTPVKTNILIFKKGGNTKKTWFFRVDDDGYELNTNRRKIKGENDLDLLEKIFDKKPSMGRSGKFFYVDYDELKDNSYDLSMKKYQKIKSKNYEYDPPEKILGHIKDIEKEISNDLNSIESFIKEING